MKGRHSMATRTLLRSIAFMSAHHFPEETWELMTDDLWTLLMLRLTSSRVRACSRELRLYALRFWLDQDPSPDVLARLRNLARLDGRVIVDGYFPAKKASQSAASFVAPACEARIWPPQEV